MNENDAMDFFFVHHFLVTNEHIPVASIQFAVSFTLFNFSFIFHVIAVPLSGWGVVAVAEVEIAT